MPWHKDVIKKIRDKKTVHSAERDEQSTTGTHPVNHNKETTKTTSQ